MAKWFRVRSVELSTIRAVTLAAPAAATDFCGAMCAPPPALRQRFHVMKLLSGVIHRHADWGFRANRPARCALLRFTP